jgi:hypothetical protein
VPSGGRDAVLGRFGLIRDHGAADRVVEVALDRLDLRARRRPYSDAINYAFDAIDQMLDEESDPDSPCPDSGPQD